MSQGLYLDLITYFKKYFIIIIPEDNTLKAHGLFIVFPVYNYNTSHSLKYLLWLKHIKATSMTLEKQVQKLNVHNTSGLRQKKQMQTAYQYQKKKDHVATRIKYLSVSVTFNCRIIAECGKTFISLSTRW